MAGPYGGKPGDTGGGSSGSSGSGSSSGSKSSTKKKPPAPPLAGEGPSRTTGPGKDYYLNFLEYATATLGLPPNPEIDALAHQAATKGWSSTIFLHFLRASDTYQNRYPGIMRDDGTLRMTESEYNSWFDKYHTASLDAGVPFGRQMFAHQLTRYGNNYQLFQERATAIKRAEENKVALAQWNDYLMHHGEIKKPLTKTELWNQLLGKGPVKFRRAWEQVNMQLTAAEAGLRVGIDITRKQLHKLAIGLSGPQQEGDLGKNFADLAQRMKQLRQIAPQLGMSVSRKDLYQLEFGGPKQTDVAARVQSLLDTYAARFEPVAAAQTVATQQGPKTLGTPQPLASD